MFFVSRGIVVGVLGVALSGTVALLKCQSLGLDDAVKLNQIQVIGTHNSYHAGIAPSEAKLWQIKNPKTFLGFDYQHPPLPEQLDSGVRQIELDLYLDTQGGLYAHPTGPRMAAEAGLPPDPPFDPSGVVAKPGFKVMHVPDFDYRSVCQPRVACLEQVRDWSHAHPNHIPIFILIETKQDSSPSPMQSNSTEPFTPAAFDALDAEIRSVFSARDLITPDDVRGSYKTLNEAVLAGNWPTLKSARGKVIFLMDQIWAGPIYLAGHQSLRGPFSLPTPSPASPMPHLPSVTMAPLMRSRSWCARVTSSARAPMRRRRRRAVTTRAAAMP